MSPPLNIAILFSGRGSNMKSLAAHIAQAHVPARLALTICNRPQAAGIAWAQAQNYPCLVIDHKDYQSREDFDAEIDKALHAAHIDLICAAGFMRILSAEFTQKWARRIINIHPSLLPKYKGLDTHARALAAGETEAGCTVHELTADMDSGPILVQRHVPILPDDTPESLATRVLAQEHIAYPQALDIMIKRLT